MMLALTLTTRLFFATRSEFNLIDRDFRFRGRFGKGDRNSIALFQHARGAIHVGVVRIDLYFNRSARVVTDEFLHNAGATPSCVHLGGSNFIDDEIPWLENDCCEKDGCH